MGELRLTDKQHYPQIRTTQPKPMWHHGSIDVSRLGTTSAMP